MAKKRRLTKIEQFQQAVQEFRASAQTVDDFMKFIQVSSYVLRPDAGLIWSELEEILKQEIENTE